MRTSLACLLLVVGCSQSRVPAQQAELPKFDPERAPWTFLDVMGESDDSKIDDWSVPTLTSNKHLSSALLNVKIANGSFSSLVLHWRDTGRSSIAFSDRSQPNPLNPDTGLPVFAIMLDKNNKESMVRCDKNYSKIDPLFHKKARLLHLALTKTFASYQP